MNHDRENGQQQKGRKREMYGVMQKQGRGHGKGTQRWGTKEGPSETFIFVAT